MDVETNRTAPWVSEWMNEWMNVKTTAATTTKYIKSIRSLPEKKREKE